MEFSFKIKINAKKEKVWGYYADINKWYIWEEDLKDIKLNGEFKTGSKGLMELENMPPLEYVLTSVKENKEFWDKTDTPLGSIHFGHEIFEEDNGWYIPFQSKKFLNSGSVEDIIVGNWPIFVDYNGVCFGMWRPFRLGGRKPIK